MNQLSPLLVGIAMHPTCSVRSNPQLDRQNWGGRGGPTSSGGLKHTLLLLRGRQIGWQGSQSNNFFPFKTPFFCHKCYFLKFNLSLL